MLTSDIYSGFLGFLPENKDENHYWFYAPNFQVTELKAGFTKIQPVPEPGGIFLILTGVIFLVALKQTKRREPGATKSSLWLCNRPGPDK